MKIGTVELAQTVLVIAEVGNNHEGHFDVAQELVFRAADAGVGAVKFQTFQTSCFVRPSDTQRYERLASYELTQAQFVELQQLAHRLGLLFISTPLDLPSAVFLREIVDAYKVASGDNNFYPMIARICETGKPVIVSSGLSDLIQVQQTHQFIQQQWARHGIRQDMAVLHCVSSYPAPVEQSNLAAISFLVRELGCTIGYSDHTLGLEACLLAVAAGARIIEKHFTLDKNFSGFRDHQLSADPDEMKRLVGEVVRINAIVGQPEKKIQPCEAEGLPLIRRSIVAGANMSAGHQIRFEDLLWLRPGDGIAPGQEDLLVGHTLRRDVNLGDTLTPADIE